MPKQLLVDKWALAKAFSVNPSTITPWLREGLASARVRPGAPQKPALYDARAAVEWFNRTKAAGQRAWAKPITPADLGALAHPKSSALRTIERLDDERLRHLVNRSRCPRKSRKETA